MLRVLKYFEGSVSLQDYIDMPALGKRLMIDEYNNYIKAQNDQVRGQAVDATINKMRRKR